MSVQTPDPRSYGGARPKPKNQFLGAIEIEMIHSSTPMAAEENTEEIGSSSAATAAPPTIPAPAAAGRGLVRPHIRKSNSYKFLTQTFRLLIQCFFFVPL